MATTALPSGISTCHSLVTPRSHQACTLMSERRGMKTELHRETHRQTGRLKKAAAAAALVAAALSGKRRTRYKGTHAT